MPPTLSTFQRVCVFIGFLLLCIAIAGLALDGEPLEAACVAFIGLCWLIGSRLSYRDLN